MQKGSKVLIYRGEFILNVSLSKRGDYVLRAAIALAKAHEKGELRKLREIVEEMGVPSTFAPQVLTDLVKTNLVTSKAGKNGGFKLVRSPESISLLQIIEAGEGPLHADYCALGEGPCHWGSLCPLHDYWSRAVSQMKLELNKVSLAQVAACDIALEEGKVVVPRDSHRAKTRSVKDGDATEVFEVSLKG